MPTLPQPLPDGVPTETQFVRDYCTARGIPVPDASLQSFFLALALFRAAAILAGVGARAALGNASSLNGSEVIHTCAPHMHVESQLL